MKGISRVVLFMVMVSLLYGCSARESAGAPNEAVSAAETEPTVAPPVSPPPSGSDGRSSPLPSQSDASQMVKAKPAKQTFPELEFQPIIWIGGSPTRPSGSGVWVYNKAQHPGNVTSINWDKNDLVLVQLQPGSYLGYTMTVQALHDLGGNVVRIVCKLTAPVPSAPLDYAVSPARWIVVPTGSLADKRFLVTDQEFNELPID